MATPIPANTTCDIYHTGVGPPSAPSVAAVPCHLKPDWRGGQEAVNACTWTHIMLIDAGVDIRDAYSGFSTLMPQDYVYIPDQHGTKFTVIFIERAQQGGADEHKRVYLDRLAPTWPTNNL